MNLVDDPTDRPQTIRERNARRESRLAPPFVIALLVALFILFAFWNRIVHIVPAGHGGVLWRTFRDGTSTQVHLEEGLRLSWPWNRVEIYELREQSYEGATTVLTTNGLRIETKWTVRFHPDPARLGALHRHLGPEYVDRFVKPVTEGGVREVVGNYVPLHVYAKDESGLLGEIDHLLRTRLSGGNVLLDAFIVRQLVLPEAITNAIEDKLSHEQRAAAYEFRISAEKAEAQRKQIEAEGIRQFEQTAGISILKWRALEATEALATAANSKVIIVDSKSDTLPVLLNSGEQ